MLVRSYPIELGDSGRVDITLTPVQGKVVLCGAILEPVLGAGSAKQDESENSMNGGDIFSKEKIISTMEKVNSYQLAHPWRPSDRNWIRAIGQSGRHFRKALPQATQI